MIARRTLERTAWALGAVLLIAYGAVRAWAENESANAVATLAASTADSAGGGSLRQEYSASKADQSLWSARRKATFEALPERDETPDGLLRIPALSLLVPVFEGVNERNLTRGAARIESTAGLGDRGNVGIAAHRDGFFRRLKDAAPGQILEIQTRTQLMRYRITEIRIVEPTDVAVLGNTAVPSVTLVTCYPFYRVGPAPRRFIVRAEIEQDPAQGPPRACHAQDARKQLRRTGAHGGASEPQPCGDGVIDCAVPLAWNLRTKSCRYARLGSC